MNAMGTALYSIKFESLNPFISVDVVDLSTTGTYKKKAVIKLMTPKARQRVKIT